MTMPLTRLLEHVLAGEPDLGDEIDAVFRDADRIRRRRTRVLIAAGAGVVATLAVTGLVLTTTLLPSRPAGDQVARQAAPAGSAVPVPSNVADPVLAVLAPAVDDRKMHIYPRPPERGNGWRQYSVTDSAGRARGTVEIAVYDVAGDMCFPVLAHPNKCARTEWAPAGVEYVRYDDEHDPDWQVNQTIARRITDGRTLAVMATGERGADKPAAGEPGLTGAQIEKIATDQRLFDAFDPAERCSGPSSGACPAFRMPVPLPSS
ncbi:hypothetical protein GCM10010172_18240 [Paractinoplanes ferrugineus]|uniref:Uncharacterized protein n=1 Tax=Paractinoplanes ferrugineus TaxID=113564 RepID=A0A919J6R3_9ACTN|nr:hypothetical protein [Actinoplanes ferrugineus]GIE14885.1 hypothetical protein Afe05nite_67250 [Actinoplanes ferrugineus]